MLKFSDYHQKGCSLKQACKEVKLGKGHSKNLSFHASACEGAASAESSLRVCGIRQLPGVFLVWHLDAPPLQLAASAPDPQPSPQPSGTPPPPSPPPPQTELSAFLSNFQPPDKTSSHKWFSDHISTTRWDRHCHSPHRCHERLGDLSHEVTQEVDVRMVKTGSS